MNIEQAKQELVKRYKYLYENAYFILAPYMYEQSNEEFEITVVENIKKYNDPILKIPLVYLNINRLDSVNSVFEEFLLSDKPMEETTLYKMIESKRNNKDYLEQVKIGLALLEKDNQGKYAFTKTYLEIGTILGKVNEYINEQSNDIKNRDNKLLVLDEYFRLLRYNNKGKIMYSGRNISINDVSSLSIIIDKNERKPLRDKEDVGVRKNSLITTIANAPHYEYNWSIFTEGEKQEVYLMYHDELPCDLEIECKLEEEYIQTTIESRLHRPKNTSPCGESFVVIEQEIFVNPNDSLYRYYQVCPHCGYIVNIPKEILSDGIKQRIEERCKKDDKLFRKMFLYSELFSLDKSSTNGQKKLLKK